MDENTSAVQQTNAASTDNIDHPSEETETTNIVHNRLKYLIINNISKHKNVTQLLESAAVFDFIPVFVHMRKMRNILPPSLVIDPRVLHFDTLTEVKQFMVAAGITIVGIEIIDSAVSLDDYSFPTNIALMPGNEGSGMSPQQINACDEFVYIPHYGRGTASLNVHVATGVILHHDFLFHEKITS